MNIENVAAKLEVLSSPVRLEVLLFLLKAGENGLVASEIADLVEVSPTNLSFHLRSLTHSSLIAVMKEGRFLRYRANFGCVSTLVDTLVSDLGQPALKLQRAVDRRGRR